MPFTPSHAVLALPFVRTPLIPAAIAVGAMTPDLPLFLRNLPLPYGRTHDPLWLAATIVLALGLLLVWRCALRPAVRELSPRWLSARLPVEWDRSAGPALRETIGIGAGRGTVSHLLLLIGSLAIGVLSHIVWDLFTHEGRWGVSAVPLLAERWGPLTGYKWVQHGSSAAGLIVIGVWMVVWLTRRDAAASVPRLLPTWLRRAWWATLPAALAVAWLWGLSALGPLDGEFTVAHLAYRVLPPACAVWGALTLALALWIQVRHRRSASRPHSTDAGG